MNPELYCSNPLTKCRTTSKTMYTEWTKSKDTKSNTQLAN